MRRDIVVSLPIRAVFRHATGVLTGNEQTGGRWTIQGTLRQGTITLIHRNGKSTNYRYQVHCRGSECYGSEYFLNGKLYSVKYIYR